MNMMQALFPDDPIYKTITQEDLDWYKNQIYFAKEYLRNYCIQNRVDGSNFEPEKPSEFDLEMNNHSAYVEYLFNINLQVTLVLVEASNYRDAISNQHIQIYAPSIRRAIKKHKPSSDITGIEFNQVTA